MAARNSNKNTQYFRLIFIIFILSITFLQFSSSSVEASTNQNLTIPSNWSGCSEVAGNINNDLTASATPPNAVIAGFWNALIGLRVGNEKNFVVPNSEHEYGGNLAGKDLYYLVRINSISNGVTVIQSSTVQLKYSLYTDCIVSGVGTTETTSSSVLPTTSTSSPDNTIPLLAGLGVIVIGLIVFGYFAIIKPRAELPQDTKITEEKQAKKQMNQTKELLNLIQDKKEANKVKKPDANLTKQKSSKRPRRR